MYVPIATNTLRDNNGSNVVSFSLSAIDCGPLLPPTNGSVQFTDTGVNSVAMYQCDEGFNLVEGDQSRTCQLNAMWSGRAPVCEGETMHFYFSLLI